MARVSLIVLGAPGIDRPSERLAACRAGLEEQGYDVEVLAVVDPAVGGPSGIDEPWCDSIASEHPGLAEAAIAGLRAARGSLLVVLDLGIGYRPEHVFAVVDRLASGEGELVVAARPNRLVGPISARFLGTTDPTSGLVGLTRDRLVEADDSLAPVGSRFTLELLARVEGHRLDVAVGRVKAVCWRLPSFGDIRQLKRLSDDRFGTASRLIQFCFVGASGMVVDLTFYALLQWIFGFTALATMATPVIGGPLSLGVAAVLAIATALTWNFTINRRLTFNDSRLGSIGRQYLRYLLSNLLGIGVSLSLRLVLPNTFGFFRAHRLAAAVVGIVAATGISFSMARWFVFDRKPAEGGRPAPIARRRIAGFRPSTSPRSSSDRVAFPELEGTLSTSRGSAGRPIDLS